MHIKQVLKKGMAITLCLMTAIGCLNNVSAMNTEKNNDDYYREVKHYIGSDLQKYKNLNNISINDNRGELVSVVEQNVYVSETKDEQGNIIDSHLMNAKEVEEFKTRDSTHMGDDSTSKGRLSITLQLFREENKIYRAYATAKWALGAGTASQAPGPGDDFVALTWGGNNNLVLKSKSISGRDYSNKSITFSQAKANSYKGYCWSFNEETSNNYLKSMQAQVSIGRVNNSSQSKQTSMRFTYIHTYQSATGSISFSGGTAGVAASVSLSSTPKKWQIEVDVPGITY